MSRILQVAEYSKEIHLMEPYIQYDDYENKDEMIKEVKEMFKLLKKEQFYNYSPSNKRYDDTDTIMMYLKPFLNIRNPEALSNRLYYLIDHFLSHVRIKKGYINTEKLPNIRQQFPNTKIKNANIIKLWRGDITVLKIDAIVNAANSQLLGCFQPSHICIDNIIHTYSGPHLRDDCSIIMEIQKQDEPTGNAKITRAYNLPSKFVIHTVGPIYDSYNHEESESLLKNCYINCLSLANEIGLHSIAFCCISTGLFGYPQSLAARTAINTVDEWLEKNNNQFNTVVFNVFTEKDLTIYQSIINE